MPDRFVSSALAAACLLLCAVAGIAPAMAESEIGGPRYYDAAPPRAAPARERVVLVMSGMIGRGAYREFRRAIARSKPEAVVLDGPGGILGEALLIAEEVRRRGLATVVAPGRRCASACAIVFLAGRTKHMGSGAEVGLHSASFEDGRADPEATGMMAGYLSHLGVPASTLRRMASTAPSDIRWLTRSEQRALRIRGLD